MPAAVEVRVLSSVKFDGTAKGDERKAMRGVCVRVVEDADGGGGLG
jgi:hypothetical protein